MLEDTEDLELWLYTQIDWELNNWTELVQTQIVFGIVWLVWYIMCVFLTGVRTKP